MNMINDIPKIVCPKCGQEYMPSEIYAPDYFFGKQKEVVRKPDGTIDFYLGDDMDLNEEFECDCGAHLKIHANLSFNVETVDDKEDDDVYITEISKPEKIKLDEIDLF